MPQPGQQFGPYQNFIPQPQSSNYNPGGGYMPTPVGGYWNQQAQQMAGPMFGPHGSSVTMGGANPIAPAQVSANTVPWYTAPTSLPGTVQPTSGGASLGALGGGLGALGGTSLAQKIATLQGLYGQGSGNPFGGIGTRGRPMMNF
jgi:hypothetical protein